MLDVRVIKKGEGKKWMRKVQEWEAKNFKKWMNEKKGKIEREK